MSLLVDFHTHIFPDTFLSKGKLGIFRNRARSWLKPFSNSVHKAQTFMRHLPEPARRKLDELSALAPLPGLLVESTPTDLKDAMESAGVDYAVVIAHYPLAPSEFILEACAENPKLLPAVSVPSGTAKPGKELKKYVEQGARILKIHPASDGEGPDSPRYKALLNAAADVGIPVILHTGCVHSHLMYKDPDQGRAERFAPWFEKFPETRFILAHMNFHEPNIALDLTEEYANLVVDTSWQPAEVIGEAVRRVGSERVLFGSDWPLVGHNLSVGLGRIRECLAAGTLNSTDAARIQGLNAAKLLNLNHPASNP